MFSRTVSLALLADVLAVLVFAATGRSSHAEGLDGAGVLGTAAPFLLGLLVGWLAGRVWRAPTRLSAGLCAVAGTVIVGLAVRGVVTGRLPWAFILVTALSLALLLLGWRAATLVVHRKTSNA